MKLELLLIVLILAFTVTFGQDVNSTDSPLTDIPTNRLSFTDNRSQISSELKEAARAKAQEIYEKVSQQRAEQLDSNSANRKKLIFSRILLYLL